MRRVWVAAALVLVFLGTLPAALGAQTRVTVTQTVNAPDPVASGQDFTYAVTYSCSSTTGSARGVVLTDTLPAEVEFRGLVPTGDIVGTSLPAVGSTGGTIVLTFIDPLPDGSSGSLLIAARYRAGSTPDATVRTNTVTVTGTDIPTENASVVTTSSAASTWAVTKSGATTATLGTNGVSYTMGLCSAGTTVGQLDLLSATLVDTLPVGVLPADVLAADGAVVSGSGAPGDPVVLTWSLGALSSVTGTACLAAASRTVSIRYPASQHADGAVVRDVATATGIPAGASSQSLGSDFVDTTLSLPGVTRTLSQAASAAGPYLGASFGWRLNPANTSAVSLDSFTVTDVLPGPFELESIFTGTGYASSPGGNFITVRYRTTANGSWTTWSGGPFAANQTLNVSSLGLSAGVYVTQVELGYGTVPAGFAASGTASSRPTLNGVIHRPSRDGSSVVDGTVVTNLATSLTASYSGLALPAVTADASVTVPVVSSTVTLAKSASTAGPFIGQSFAWRLAPTNTGTSPLEGLTLTDTVPGPFTLQSVYTGTGYASSPTGSFITLRYKTNSAAGWITWSGSPFATGQTLTVASLGLSAGLYVTDVELGFGTVPVGFASSGTAANQPALNGVVNNPARNGATIVGGTSITNANATATASYGGAAVTPATASATVTIPVASSAATLTKASSRATPSIGQSFGWQLYPTNSGATPLDQFTLTDTLPANFTLTSVFTGTGYVNGPSGSFIAVRYKTNSSAAWLTWTGSPFATNQTLNVSSLSLAGGLYVTDVELNLGTVGVGFGASGTATNRPTLTGAVNNPARDGSVPSAGLVITNLNATLTASYGGTPITPATASATATIPTGAPSLSLLKSASITNAPIGQSFAWRFMPTNSGNTILDSFTIVDTLPDTFTLQSVFTGTGYSLQPSGNFVTLRYKTNSASSWTTWPGGPFATNTTQNVTALGLASGLYVTDIEIGYGSVGVGFGGPATAANRPRLNGVVTNPARNGATVIAGTVVTNLNATLDATAFGDPVTESTSTAVVTNALPLTTYTLTKSASTATPYLGQSYSWRFLPTSTATIPLESFTVTDTLPDRFELRSVFTGTGYLNSSGGSFINLRYQTTANPAWTAWPGGPFSTNLTLQVTNLGLANGVFVTAVEYGFGTVPVGFAASATAANQPNLTGTVTSPARNGATVPVGTVITNTASLLGATNGVALLTVNANANATLRSGYTVGKAASTPNPQFESNFDWWLNLTNASAATVTNFTLADTLPAPFELLSVFTGTRFVASPTGNFITVRYKSASNAVWTAWPGGPFTTNRTLSVSGLGLTGADHVTDVEMNFGSVGSTFAASGISTNRPTLSGRVRKLGYDGASPVADGTVLTNTATLVGMQSGLVLPMVSTNVTATLATPTLGTTLAKTASTTTPQVGAAFSWSLDPANASTVPLDAFTVTDTLPDAFTLQSVYTGNGYPASMSGAFVGVRYRTTAHPGFVAWPGSPFAANQTLAVSGLGLASGEYVAGVELSYGTVPVGFGSTGTRPALTGVVTAVARNGQATAEGLVVSNLNATVTASFGGVALSTTTASAGVTMRALRLTPRSVKTVTSGTFAPGSVIAFQVETWNDAASETALVDAIGLDLLPAEVDYVPGTFAEVTSGSYNSGGLAEPTLEVLPLFSGARTLLRWHYSGSMAPGTRSTVTFNVRVRQGIAAATYSNQSHVGLESGPGQLAACPTGTEVTDTLDLDGDSSSSDVLCGSNPTTFAVGGSASVRAIKYDRGQSDVAYSRYPAYGATVAGGVVDYQIGITNTGSVNLGNLVLIDILPAENDVGVVDPSPRLSSWKPELTGPENAPISIANATVYYTSAANPCRDEVGGPSTGCTDPAWSTTPPVPVSLVTAFKIVWDPGVILQPGGSLVFSIPMRAPLDVNDGSIAWNSFAYVVTALGIGTLSAEPNKVGVVAVNQNAIGNFVWLDINSDGYQDPGEPGLPNVRVQLFDTDGNLVASRWTDTSGHYLFSNPGTEDFYVHVDETTLPAGLTQTTTYLLPHSDHGNQDQSTGPGDYGYFVPIRGFGRDFTADFGYNFNPTPDVTGNTGTGTIGDRVWLDLNGDGHQDPDEMGIRGVTLELLNAASVVVASTTTAAGGVYRFDGLTAGAYRVRVSSSAGASHDILGGGYTQTGDPDHYGAANTAAPANDGSSTVPIVLAPGDVFMNVDFGYQPTGVGLGTIGDQVWLDVDASGTAVPGVGEIGLADVTLALVEDTNGNGVWDDGEAVIANTVTDANGEYAFHGLPVSDARDGNAANATYLVWVNDTGIVLARLRPAYDKDGIATPGLAAVTLSPGSPTVTDADFSYAPNSQPPAGGPNFGLIGDTVWFDANRNGLLDGSELGIPYVLVELLDSEGRAIALTYTGMNGAYYFGGLDPTLTYSVRIAQANFLAGAPLVGLESSFDPDGGGDGTAQVALGALGSDGNLDPDGEDNGINLAQDFGYGPPAGAANQGAIGNLIWHESNGDGVWNGANGADGVSGTDDDEPGIAGVTVNLYRDLNQNGGYDPGEPRIATTTTDAAGLYSFTGVPLVDGMFDPLLNLTDPDAAYVVDVDDGQGHLFGFWHVHGTPGVDGEGQIEPYAVVLTSTSRTNLTADFAYSVTPASLGNRVWLDANGNGVQDTGEANLGSVPVHLTVTYPNGAGVTTLDTATDAEGFYWFGNLLLDPDYRSGTGPGQPQFQLAVETPSGLVPTHIGAGSNAKLDSNDSGGAAANPTRGATNVVAIIPASLETTAAGYDFGFYAVTNLISLGNRVWLDVDTGGTISAGEVGIAGVKVELLSGTGTNVLATVFTEASGYYRFDGLLPADYRVRLAAQNWTGITGSPGGTLDGTRPLETLTSSTGSANAVQTSGTGAVDLIDHGVDAEPPSAAGIQSLVVTLALGNQLAGESDVTASGVGAHGPNGDSRDHLALDFGLVGTASIGDRVWVDTDGDGRQDAGEAGLDGVPVRLYLGTGALFLSTTTSSGGAYIFRGLLPNSYFVEVGLPDGYRFSPRDVAGGEAGDSDVDTVTGRTGTFSLAAGEAISTVDAGVYQPAGIGNLVWRDSSGDGLRGNALVEPGIDGVEVWLYEAGDTLGTTPRATTTTAGGGLYQFTDLAPGSYRVYLPNPAPGLGLAAAPLTGGTDNQQDNNQDGSQPGGFDSPIVGPVVVLSSGELDSTVDFGLLGVDYGDLGDPPYLTTLAHNGARHALTASRLRLGSLVDADSGTLSDAGAAADDLDGTSDEDGVVIPPLLPGTTAKLTLTSSGVGRVNAFFDWNGDGDFDDADESVTEFGVVAGANTLLLSVPVAATAVQVPARFRLSTAGGLGPTGPAADGEVEDYRAALTSVPTLAVVFGFTSRTAGDETVVSWQTASEAATSGFRLEQESVATGEWTVVEPFVPALRSPVGAEYRVKVSRGSAKSPNDSSGYRLVELEDTGGQRVHGPYKDPGRSLEFTVAPVVSWTGAIEAETSFLDSGWESTSPTVENRLRRGTAGLAGVTPDAEAIARTRHEVAPPRVPMAYAVVETREEGIYAVTADVLATATGRTAEAMRGLLAARAIAVVEEGVSVSSWPSPDGTALCFYAPVASGPYASTRHFWIVGQRQVAMGGVDDSGVTGSGRTWHVRVESREIDRVMVGTLGAGAEADPWMWDLLLAGGTVGTQRSIGLTTTNLVRDDLPAEAWLKIRLWGADTGTRRIRALIQNAGGSIEVGETTWSGKGRVELDAHFVGAVLREGSNRLVLQAEVPAGAEPFSAAYLDRVDYGYPARARAVAETAAVVADGETTQSIDGFRASEVEVLDVTEPRQAEFVAVSTDAAGGGGFEATFATHAAHRYFAAGRDAWRTPERVRGVSLPELASFRPGARHVIVAPAAWSEAARELAEYRATQGLETRVVTMEAIADEFGSGTSSPQALSAFLRQARARWPVPPETVLLLGDGSYDYRDLLAAHDNLIPPAMVSTAQGLYASDTTLAGAVPEREPELVIGRIPVTSADEARAVIAKIRTYESAVGSAVSRSVLLLADGSDAGGSFGRDQAAVGSILAGGSRVRSVAFDELGSVGTVRDAVRAAFGADLDWVSYSGHGGHDRLGAAGYLTSADLAALGPDQAGRRWPVVTAMTCVAGDFAVPGQRCLAENLVLQPDGGAIAVWAPTGLSIDASAQVLNRAIAGAWNRALPGQRLGDLVREARAVYRATDHPRELLDIYTLFGDPALRVR